MESNSIEKADRYIAPLIAPPPAPREPELEVEGTVPEPAEDSSKKLDLYA